MIGDRVGRKSYRVWATCAGATLLTVVAAIAVADTAGAHTRSANPGSKPPTAAQLASGSISGVVTLHDLAVTVKPGSKAPRAHAAFTHLAASFASEVQTSTVVGAPAASLARTLRVYRQLASEVAASAAKANPTLPSAFTATIKANDKKWKAALTAIGKAAHLNILKSVPKLLYATGTAK